MVRFAIALTVVLLAGCGPDDSLPASVPTVPADGGVGLGDAGFEFLEACSAAGCVPSVCEPLDGGAVRCGVACGAACGSPCVQNRCDDPDAGWVDVFCNMAGASMVWTRDATCDDGNGCTKNDICQGGTCEGVADTGQSCNDGNVCTSNDKCNAQATCVGTAVTAGSTSRFYNSGASIQNYAYGPSSDTWWVNTAGYTDQGAIYASVPGGQSIKECRKTTGSLDHVLILGSESGYTCDCGDAHCATGLGVTTHQTGTVPLRKFLVTGANKCGGQTPCSFFTTGNGPSGSTEVSTGIYVCPAP